MKHEYFEAYEYFFKNSYRTLFRTLKIRLEAQKICKKKVEQTIQLKFQNTFAMILNKHSKKPKDDNWA